MKALRLAIFFVYLTTPLASWAHQQNTCESISYQYPFLRAIPLYIGSTFMDKPSTETFVGVKGKCFRDIQIYAKMWYEGEAEKMFVEAEFILKDPLHWVCTEDFLIANAFADRYHYFFTSGSHKVTIETDDAREVTDLFSNGVRFFIFCADATSVFSSTIESLFLFAGGLGKSEYVPLFGSQISQTEMGLNTLFVASFMQRPLNERYIQEVKVPASSIKSGDVFLIRRFQGFDSSLMVATGGAVSQAGIALWISGELYVLKQNTGVFYSSQAVAARVSYEEFIEQAKATSEEVVWLPLGEEVQFDEEMALEEFESMEGMPFGLNTVFFGLIDTLAENYPPPFSAAIVPILMRYLDYFAPRAFKGAFLDGLNKRAGYEEDELIGSKIWHAPTSFEEFYMRMLYQGNQTLAEILQIPEQDSWEYESNGKSRSSASFVVSILKAAGAFSSLPLQATEFTARDLSQLKIYSTSPRPEVCQEADPHLGYCQLLGKYRIELEGWNELEAYAGMNERCPSLPPKYERPEGC